MKLGLNNLWMVDPSKVADVVRDAMHANDARRMGVESRIDSPSLMSISGGIAVIDVFGPLVKRPDVFDIMFGSTSTQAIEAAIREAAAEESVKSIMMRIDSPGGSVDGLAELGDAIFQARDQKPVIAQITGMAASAGYYVASQATKIFAQRMDMVGSIGTVFSLIDASKAFEEAGLEVVTIDTGEFKSAGEFGTEITDRHKAEFQKIVDGFFNDFISVIVRGRGISEKKVREAADGRMFFAEEAVSLGLIDGIRTAEETHAAMTKTIRSKNKARTRMALAKNRIIIS